MLPEKALTEIGPEAGLLAWLRRRAVKAAVSRGLEVKLLAGRWMLWRCRRSWEAQGSWMAKDTSGRQSRRLWSRTSGGKKSGLGAAQRGR